MKYSLRSAKRRETAQQRWQSVRQVASQTRPGVLFSVVRMSFRRRMELIREVRGLVQRAECLAGTQSAADRMEASLIEREIDLLLLRWGLDGVDGLEIDGFPATPETLVALGPEDLCREAVRAVRAECFVSEGERKN